MDEKSRDTVSLVKAIVSSLVDDPDQVEISSTPEEEVLLIEINVAPDDISKVIGRNGRIIKSIRTLARSVASVEGVDRVDVEIIS